MNTKSLALVGALSLGFGSLAGATQYVYVTGSTAARAAFFSTCTNGSAVFDAAPIYVTQGSSDPSKASYMNFHGNVGGVDTILKCHWSGSEAGITDISGTKNETFLTDGAPNSLNSTTPGPTLSSPVDLAMADNDKAFSRNPNAAITGVKVCIIPFKWVKQRGSAANLVNLTDQAVRQALQGNGKLSIFTGNAADTTFVYVSGRDNQSGTRVNQFGETGFGIFTPPSQLQVDSTGAMIQQGDGSYLGDWGYNGGGSLATQMGYDLSQASSVDVSQNGTGVEKFSIIAFMGISDAVSAINNSAIELTYNGIPYSSSAVIEGLWNFWGNEFCYRKNTVSSQALTVFNNLTGANGISANATGTYEISLTAMHAHRAGPTTDPLYGNH